MKQTQKPTLPRTIRAKAIELGFDLSDDDAYEISVAVVDYVEGVTNELRKAKHKIEYLEHEIHSEVEQNKALQAKLKGNDVDSHNEEDNPPYLVEKTWKLNVVSSYNPDYGDDRECECGHPYHRHFDSYEDMEAVGCKYCQCNDFKEKVVECSCKLGEPYNTLACPIHGSYKL